MIDISKPTLSFDAQKNLWRLEAVVNGHPVYFQSKHELAQSTEAFLCAFFVHSKARNQKMRIAGAVDHTLAASFDALSETIERFWGFKGPTPEVETFQGERHSEDVGMFFTCGVDSFYTLTKNISDIKYLINVHGFDITLSDTDRQEKALRGLSRTSQETGLELIQVETNLREHPVFNLTSWRVTHGAALAAIAHVLSKHVGAVRVSGTDVPGPHGSHRDLDGLWSSSAVRLINDEVGIKRLDKVQDISQFEPTYRSLKVCWKNLADDLNCGICEKCVRTQTSLNAYGVQKKYLVFPEGPLVPRIHALPQVPPHLVEQWRDLGNKVTDVPTKRAIKQLIVRSQVKNTLRDAALKLGAQHVKRALIGR